MISYRKNLDGTEITKAHLESLIENHKPGWIQRATDRTEEYKLAGKVTPKSHIWSEIKEVLMKIQGNKCAFCERELEGVAYGKGAIDVEHFRPKNNVRKWKVSQEYEKLGIPLTAPQKNVGGYYLLTYNIMNYTIACGPCNQAIKSDIFPILGAYNTKMEDPISESSDEKPLLIYPIGNIDQDCEELIEFVGAVPKTKSNKEEDFRRGITTIQFFSLSDANTRGILFKERSELIVILGALLIGIPVNGQSEAIIQKFMSDTSKHANCARSFVRLFNTNPVKAKTIFEEAKSFLSTYVPV